MAARPFRLTAPEPFEQDIHEAFAHALDNLLVPPAQWCCYPAGHVKLSAAQVARLARAGLKRSFPDFFVFYRLVWAIELKRLGGKLSKSRIVTTKRGSPRYLIGQQEMFPLLMATGAFGGIATCTSIDEGLAQLRRWGIPLRGLV
jgi:hypothetical protein